MNAYTASLFYAVDRFAAYRDDWGAAYEDGELILADRYTTSNIVHQGAKLPEDELQDFFAWVADIEYRKMGIPEPDCVFYLDVDLPTSTRRIRSRAEKHHTASDIHETDVEYLERCLRTARKACDFFGWSFIPFDRDGVERNLMEKNDDIYRQLLSYLHSSE